ncbi:endonuclease/exonuclease/phosphatase family protein [Streptomyces sp. SID13726]|uniref:endonuclease/exonuclease/phosphatase family protein n=1 Tax=Streptomyces sp. SID13726 TaxID=2706058 RepID=UPI0013BDC72B|nr:endonuclease/exonuclease/phosphatase family protein [Streptomyces sp. SID13726]NEB01886.1 endonuclease/exonuclease/phosphatase family protein [Streptomyces sp. SID13726]
MLTIGNYNAFKLRLDGRGTDAWKARVAAVRELDPDILGVQEIVVDAPNTPRKQWDAAAADTVAAFADDCGLTAGITPTDGYPHGVAMAADGHPHRAWYTAALWKPGAVGYVPDSYRPLGVPDFWHGLTTIAFDVGSGEPVVLVVYQGDPFRPDWRFQEALRIKGLLRRTGGVKPAVVVGDFNSLSAARVPGPDGALVFYDGEAYAEQDHDDLEYQVQAGTMGGAQLADRGQSEVLLRRGYMVDVAAHLGAPWQATTGHWEDGKGDPDPWGPRRIDLILATRPVAPAVTAYGVLDSETALAGSDHRIIWATVDPALIAVQGGGR